MKPNRTTTYESLCAVIRLILAEDKETFKKYYKLATHDDNGISVWYYIQTRNKRI